MIPCSSCLQALHPYIDRELTDEDIVQVREHLDACRGCLHLFQFEASVRRLVRTKCQELQAPPSLRVRITECLAVERTKGEKRQGPSATP